MIDGVDVATLGVKVTLDGAEAAAAGLDKVAQSGANAEAAAKRFIGTNDGLTASQRAVLAMTDEQRRAYEGFTGTTLNLGAAQADLLNMYNTSRPIVLAHAQALEMDAAAHGEAAAATGVHGLQLGRLNMELGTFLGRLTGANTAVTRLGAMVGGSLVGYGEMIAALAAIAGLIWVFEKLTSDTSEAKKAQDELTTSLEKWYEVQQRGVAGARLQELDAELTLVRALTTQYETLKEVAPAAYGGGNEGALQFGAIEEDRAAKIKAQLDKANAAMKAGQDEVNATLSAAITDRATRYVGDLANLVKTNNATAVEHAKAVAMLHDFEQQLKGAALTASPEMRNQLAEWAKTLSDALKPQKVDVEPVVHGTNDVVEALLKQLDALRKVNEEDNVGIQQAQDQVDAVGKQGAALELLHSQQTANLETLKAYHDLSGVSLTDRLAAIDTEKTLRDAAIAGNAAIADRVALLKQVADIGEKNTAIGKAQIDETAKQIKAQNAADEQMRKAWLNFLDQVSTSGIKSFTTFFAEVERLFTRLLVDLEKQGKGSGGLGTLLGLGSSAVTGGLAGFGIGEQSGNSTTGAFGGAASGALAGGEIAGPWGAAAGALFGAASGLLGAADNQKKAAEALQKAAEQSYSSLISMNVKAGTSSQRASDIIQARDAADALADAIDKALPGLKNQTEREKELAQVRADEAIIVKQIDDAAKEEQHQTDLTLAARKAYALGLKDEGDALARQATEEKEVADALAAHWTDAQIAALKLDQALEDAAIAADKAAAALEATTRNVADLTAQFQSLMGSTDASAWTTLLEQQREAMNSATAPGSTQTPEEVAMLNVVQLLQRGQLQAQQDAAKQTALLQGQLDTANAQLSTAKTQLQTDTAAAQTLGNYSNSLATGSLSALSPLDQLNAAKAQRDTLFARAQGGDASAASDYQSADQTYLQLDRGYNASGGTYAADFAQSQQMASQLAAQYAGQESRDQQMVDALQKQVDLLTQQMATLKDANTIAQATRDAAVAELNATTNAALSVNGPLIDQFAQLRTVLTGLGSQIADAEHTTLLGDQNALSQATGAEIAAIQSGASLTQLAQLDAVRQLELQKTGQDDYYAKQLADNLKIYGPDSAQVQSIIALQAAYDDKAQAQIDAINATTAAINSLKPFLSPGNDAGTPSTPGGGGGKVSPPGTPVTPTNPVLPGNGGGTWSLYDPYNGITYVLPLYQTTLTDPQGNYWDGSWHQFAQPALPTPGSGAGGGGSAGGVGGTITTPSAGGAEIVTTQQAQIAVMQDGFTQMIAAQTDNSAQLVALTKEVRLGLEGVKAAVA